MAILLTPRKPYWPRAPRGRFARDTYPSIPWKAGMAVDRTPLSPWLYPSGETPDGRHDPLKVYIVEGQLPERAVDRARFRSIVGLAEHRGCPKAREAGRALGVALRHFEASRGLRSPTSNAGLAGLWAAL